MSASEQEKQGNEQQSEGEQQSQQNEQQNEQRNEQQAGAQEGAGNEAVSECKCNAELLKAIEAAKAEVMSHIDEACKQATQVPPAPSCCDELARKIDELERRVDEIERKCCKRIWPLLFI